MHNNVQQLVNVVYFLMTAFGNPLKVSHDEQLQISSDHCETKSALLNKVYSMEHQ